MSIIAIDAAYAARAKAEAEAEAEAEAGPEASCDAPSSDGSDRLAAEPVQEARVVDADVPSSAVDSALPVSARSSGRLL